MNPDKRPNTPTGPVMDVQRPRPTPAPSEVTTPLDNPMAPADSITGATPDPGQISGQQTLQQTQAMSGKGKKNRTGLIVGIITGVIILLVGAGIGGFIWYKNNNKTAPVSDTTQSESERVNVEEIDTTLTDIDQTLNTVNDSTDITPGDVSDTSLGL